MVTNDPPNLRNESRGGGEVERDVAKVLSDVNQLRSELDQQSETQGEALTHVARLAECSRRLRALAKEVPNANAIHENKTKITQDIRLIHAYIGDMLGYVTERHPLDDASRA